MMTDIGIKEKSEKIAIGVIIIFHIIGLIGLSVPYAHALFLSLVPFHLLLMAIILIFNHKDIDNHFVFFFLCLFVSGCVVEWLGANKHLLFGNYYYGTTLGFKLSGVPLIIGVNWFLLMYAAGVLMQYSQVRNRLFRVLAGASILVLLDILIEPVAVRFGYWHWANGVVPVSNYVCWFLVSGFMLLLFERFHFKKQNLAGPVLLITQFVFFIVLHWL